MNPSTWAGLRSSGRRFPSVSAACLAAALALAVAGVHADDGWQDSFPVAKTNLASVGRNPYFVLEPGYRLHYSHGDETLTISVLDETKLVDGVETRVVEERDAAPDAGFTTTSLALPGAPPDGVLLDYLVVGHARNRVWLPAGGTGSTDVIDTQTLDMKRIENFPTAEIERGGMKRTIGPSSATVGDGVVYVGNRGDSTVCAVDAETLTRGGCVTLPSMPDGVSFVARSQEVWVTTPRDQSIVILDVSVPTAPKIAGRIELEGDPEGFAVDNVRGFFYTNLEDKDRTLRIDIATRTVTATWMPECGDAGPRCLLIDPTGKLLMVACPDRVEVLDAGGDGAILSRLETGDGLDSFDYLPDRRFLFLAAGRAATLTIARLDESGGLERTAVVPTAPGARNAVVTADGVVFVAVGPEGKVLVVHPVD